MDDLFSAGHARALDAADPLPSLRGEFLVPRHGDGDQAYFCGNSLGLQPRGVRAQVDQVLEKWATEAVEVVAMNSLTDNLHLMLASFYRPGYGRDAILVEAGSFPSDRHAVESQLALHGVSPAQALVEVEPDEPGGTVSMAAIGRAIGEHGPRLALVLWPGVQYRTGQAFDLAEITRMAHAAGAVAGFDLAHSVGNLPLALHDSGADFAVWCHYKYMNAGPGAVAGIHVLVVAPHREIGAAVVQGQRQVADRMGQVETGHGAGGMRHPGDFGEVEGLAGAVLDPGPQHQRQARAVLADGAPDRGHRHRAAGLVGLHLHQRLRRRYPVQCQLRLHRMAVGGKTAGFDQDRVAPVPGPVEAGQHQVQVVGERVHRHHLDRLRRPLLQHLVDLGADPAWLQAERVAAEIGLIAIAVARHEEFPAQAGQGICGIEGPGVAG